MTFQIIDTQTGQIINDFGNGSILSRDDLGNFAIAYEPTNANTNRVEFVVNGTPAQTDTAAPFVLTSNDASTGFTNGDLLIEAREIGSTGQTLNTSTVTATVVGSGAADGGAGTGGGAIDLPEVKSELNVEAEAEGEAETEVEAEVSEDAVGAAIAAAASAAAYGANALTQTAVTGSLDLGLAGATDRTQASDLDRTGEAGEGTRAVGGDNNGDTTGSATPPVAQVSILSSEAEAEVEIEAEVEVEVGAGAAAAGAGAAAATAAVGTVIYTDDDGQPRASASETSSAIDVASSTSSSLSNVSGQISYNDTPDSDNSEDDASNTEISSNSQPINDLTDDGASGLRQADSETEVEVESEAEAEAETGTGVAAAGVAGGSGVAISGEFGAADTETSVRTSTSTSAVTEQESTLFNILNSGSQTSPTVSTLPINGTVFNALNPTPNGNLAEDARNESVTEQPRNTDSPDGYGQSEAEAEAESEVEVEAEVGNNSAAVAAIATGGAGATGVNATSIASTSAVAATSTSNNNGDQIGRNDVVETATERSSSDFEQVENRVFERMDEDGNLIAPPAETEAEAEAEAEVDLSGALPTTSGVADGDGLGDAAALSTIAMSGVLTTRENTFNSGVQAVEERPDITDEATREREVLAEEGATVVASVEAIEVEREAEAEAEVEVEIGFNAAAAGAGASAVQGGNSAVGITSEAATATSVATSVYDNDVNTFSDVDLPGPEPLGQFGDLVTPAVNPADLILEIETEAEAEAEVGIGAGAAAAAAGSAGLPGIDSDTKTGATTNAAAAAAASGANIEIIIEMPDDGEEGEVYAYARAWDPAGGGVAVAVAVAGLSIFGGLDNEAELEAEGLYEAIVEVRVDTRELSSAEAAFLFDLAEASALANGATDSDAEGEGPDSRFESETEVEAEAEAEAGYGVAAAGAAVAAAGAYADVAATTAVKTSTFVGMFGEAIEGTLNDDDLSGTDGIDNIVGNSGNDDLSGGKSGDRLDGGDGNDFIQGNEGNDNLSGGRGDDFLNGGQGDDFVDGQGGTDTAFVGDVDDIFKDSSGLTYAVSKGGAERDIFTNVERFETNATTLNAMDIRQFDGLTYIATNIDKFGSYNFAKMSEAQINDLGASVYATKGLERGDETRGFSAENYIKENPDLPPSAKNDLKAATLNYIRSGAEEGREAGASGDQSLAPTNASPTVVTESYETGGELQVNAANGVLANDFDANGDMLTAEIATTTQNGTLTLNGDGSFSYVANTGFVGEDKFTYNVSDGTSSSQPVEATLLVDGSSTGTGSGTPITGSGQPVPVANDDELTFQEGGTILIDVADLVGNDEYSGDRSSLTVSAVRGDTGPGVAGLQDRVIEYQLPTDYYGTFELLYTVSVGETMLRDEGIVRVTVENINDLPMVNPDSFKVAADTTLTTQADRSILRNDSDIDGDTLTAVLDQDVSNGTLRLNEDGSFEYTPDAGYEGEDFFTYFANDGTANSASSTRVDISIPVTEPGATKNLAPIAVDDKYDGVEDQVLTIKSADVLSNDRDQDNGPNPIQIAGVFGAVGGSVSLEDANIFFRPDQDFNGTASFVYVLSDEGLTDNGLVEIDFAAVNDAPVANDEPEPFFDRYTAYTGSTMKVVAGEGVLFNDTDADGEVLDAALVMNAMNGDVTLNADGSFDYTPNAGFVGQDEFTYKASDGIAESAETRVIIDVTAQGVEGGNGGSAPTFNNSNGGSGGTTTNGGNLDGDQGWSSPTGGATAMDDTYNGSEGNNRANGGDGNDTLNGNGGNDQLTGAAGQDVLNGGAGMDMLDGREKGAFEQDTLDGGQGGDSYMVNGSLETETSDIVVEASGNTGNDTVTSFGSYFADTNGVAETLIISDDAARSESGLSTIIGGDNDKTIQTSSGMDLVETGAGNTVIQGSAGTDFFVFQSSADGTDKVTLELTQGGGEDFIYGLDATKDQIDLSAYDLALTPDEFIGTIMDDPFTGSAYVNIGDSGDALVFEGVSSEELTSDVFIF
ncbi:tandem-95 repeat protein [Yoonia sp. 208BN28-4]|uniref:tandem-95 repeat protein n=1 Tax=Yoonia sp. 208BN28-4 TaxID=3126505 RepID=UPI0030B6CD8D